MGREAALDVGKLPRARHSHCLRLPAVVRNRRISPATFDLIIPHSVPMIARVEKVMRAGRLKAFTGPIVQTLLGIRASDQVLANVIDSQTTGRLPAMPNSHFC